MDDKQENQRKNTMLLPALIVANYANWTPTVISSLLLIEIAETFNAPVGITGQMTTFSSALAIVAAIFAGILSVKYGPRKLLIAGLTLHIISAIGSGLAPSLSTLFLAFSFSGLALAIVSPMVQTLLGEHIPTEERPKVQGWLIAASTLTFIIGSPLVGYLETLGGWRLSFFAYYLPIVLLASMINYRSIPVSKSQPRTNTGIFYGIRNVLSDSSARSCLAGMAFTEASYYSIFFYSISFFRVSFNIPLAWASLLVSATNLLSVVGSLSGAKLVNRFGRKTLAVVGCALAGFASISYVLVTSMWLSLFIVLVGTIICGLRLNALMSLSLEQVPEFRGSMMSLNSASLNLGLLLGAGIGGYALLGGDWVLMGVSIGVLGLLAAAILQVWAVDPVKQLNP